MDSRTVLDYALFQLTPTRTRCDLVIFAGKKNEKIASGLLEPFISHLKSAKDQISKGGYSITLKPTSDSCSWFTKATLERFVRFVSTPEVLERFVTIEREIDQIESSVESNEQANGTVEIQDDEAEEKPKVRLQRVLETRKAMLKKEQAMAHARSLVAGFEMDYLYDLVSFSEAFGALRLREACMNFMELCNRKNNDKIWMDQVAAMQASYLGASDLPQMGLPKISTSDSITTPGSLDNDGLPAEFSPQQAEGVAPTPTWANHLPQYAQGPMFQQLPPYPGYIFPGVPSHYPVNMPWSRNFHNSSTYPDRDGHKYRSSHKKKEKHAVKNDESESDNSSSISDSSDDQEHEPSHGQKHKKRSSRKVVIRNINYITSGRNDENETNSSDEAAVESLKRHHKPNSDKKSNKSKNFETDEDERNGGSWDIFQNILMKEAESTSTVDTGSKMIHVQEDESSLGKKSNQPKYASKDDEFLIPSRLEREYDSQNGHFDTEASVIKAEKEEDWIVKSKSEISPTPSATIDHDLFPYGVNKKDVLTDDSFMVQSRVSGEPQQTDSFMVSDIVGADQSEDKLSVNNNQENVKVNNFDEPQDIYMMLDRGSPADQSYDINDISIHETVRSRSSQEPKTVSKKELKPKVPSSTLRRSKSETLPKIPSKSKVSTSGSTTVRNKADKEEEKRKKMEELLIQRQKRIAERSAAKVVKVENERKNRVSTKIEKAKPPVENKPVMRSSTIERLAAARTPNKQPSMESKVSQKKKPVSRGNPSAIKKTKGSTQVRPDKVNPPSDKNDVEEFGNVKELHTVTSVEKKEASSNDTRSFQISSEEMQVQGPTQETTTDDCSTLISKNDKGEERKKLTFSPEIIVLDNSTPPENSEAMNQELLHSRKKWNNGENSPKAPKGFRRLLLFGRRS